MKADKNASPSNRAAAKAASRHADRQRIKNGEKPEVIQQENSIFPAEFFEKGRFSNLSRVIGR